jgi:hypothetical protein
MATQILLRDFMTKRSIMKSSFKSENFKGRWFVLTSQVLAYHAGSPDGRMGRLKGEIHLKKVTAVEKVERDYFDRKPNTFQVVFTNSSGKEVYTLYIMALTADKQDEWIQMIRVTSEKCGASFSGMYHLGLFNHKYDNWPCCEKKGRHARGCTPITWSPGTEMSYTPKNSEDDKSSDDNNMICNHHSAVTPPPPPTKKKQRLKKKRKNIL